MSPRQQSPLNPRRLLMQGLACALGVGFGSVTAQPRRRLTVAAFPAVDEIVRAATPAWRARYPDVDVRVVSRQFADHHTAMTTALTTSVYLPDVMALEVGYVGRFARGGGLTDLSRPPFHIDRLRSRYVPYAYDQATAPNGAVVAAPADIGPGTLLYRQDVLARAGVTPEALTATWPGYVEAGRQLKAASGAYLLPHARDLKDILIRVGVGPGEGLYFDSASKVLVDTPRFVRAFELAREVRRDKLDARVAAWSNEWSEGFKRGTLATQPTGAWMAGHMSNWLAPDTRGLWRAAQLPGGAFVAFGGTFFALPRDADTAMKPLAWELVQLLTLDRSLQLQAFKQQDAFPASVEALNDPFFDEDIAFLGGQPARQLWRDAAQRITAVQVHKQDAFAGEVIDTELDKVLDRGKDIASALGDASRLLARRAFR